jgi:hypothetical protein
MSAEQMARALGASWARPDRLCCCHTDKNLTLSLYDGEKSYSSLCGFRSRDIPPRAAP